MNTKIQVLLRQFEGEYHYPNGLLSDAADYIDALERELEQLKKDAEWRSRWHQRLGRGEQTEGKFYERLDKDVTITKDVSNNPIMDGDY